MTPAEQSIAEYEQWRDGLAATVVAVPPSRPVNLAKVAVGGHGHCVYCGARTAKTACRNHADLLLVDPFYAGETGRMFVYQEITEEHVNEVMVAA